MAYKCFRSLIYQSTDPAVIVLEDLSVNGFKTLQAPEDYETSKLIFQRLAVFHAATFHLLENVRKSILQSGGEISFSFLHKNTGRRLQQLQLLGLPHARVNSRVVLQTQLEDIQESVDGECMARAEQARIYRENRWHD